MEITKYNKTKEMNNQDLDKIKYEAVKSHVNNIRKFLVNLLIFCIIFLLFNASDLFKTDTNFGFGNVSAIFWIWGIILAVKAAKLFIFDYDWERKTIEKYLKNK